MIRTFQAFSLYSSRSLFAHASFSGISGKKKFRQIFRCVIFMDFTKWQIPYFPLFISVGRVVRLSFQKWRQCGSVRQQNCCFWNMCFVRVDVDVLRASGASTICCATGNIGFSVNGSFSRLPRLIRNSQVHRANGSLGTRCAIKTEDIEDEERTTSIRSSRPSQLRQRRRRQFSNYYYLRARKLFLIHQRRGSERDSVCERERE